MSLTDWQLNLNRDYVDATAFGDIKKTYLVPALNTGTITARTDDPATANAVFEMLRLAWENHVSVGSWLPAVITGMPDGDVFVTRYEMRSNSMNIGVPEFTFTIEVEFA